MPAEVTPVVPRLFQEELFGADTFAEAVNHFVSLGEKLAIRQLKALAPDYFLLDTLPDTNMEERVSWVCRVLFVPVLKEPIRPPMYGDYFLPYQSMPLSNWPLFPVAAAGDSFFVLGQGGIGASVPEQPWGYIACCREEGCFRTDPVPVPTRAQAQQDVAALRASPAWRAIKWEDSGRGWSYSLDEDWTFRFIQAQADSTK